MNDNVRKWINALRSGQYEQSFHTLRSNRGFCCLGVACDISGLGGWLLLDHDINDIYTYRIGSQGFSLELPLAVSKWLKLKKEDGAVSLSSPPMWGYVRSLAEANDHGWTFNKIADILEEHADELFNE